MRSGKKSLLEPRDKPKPKIALCGCILDSEEEIADFWKQNSDAMISINGQNAFLVNRNPQNDFEYFSNIVGKVEQLVSTKGKSRLILYLFQPAQRRY